VQAALAGADVALVELFDRAHARCPTAAGCRGDDEPAIQTRGEVGRAGRSPPGTAGSQDARRDQRGHPVGHPTSKHPQQARLALGRAGCTDCSPGNGNLRRCVSSPRRMIGSTRSTLGARFRHPQFDLWLTQLVGGQRLGARRRRGRADQPHFPNRICRQHIVQYRKLQRPT